MKKKNENKDCKTIVQVSVPYSELEKNREIKKNVIAISTTIRPIRHTRKIIYKLIYLLLPSYS